MGTSKAYGSPKWPGVTLSVGNAAKNSSAEKKVAAAVGAFSRAYKKFLSAGTLPPGEGGQGRGAALDRRGASGGGRGGGGGGAARASAATGGTRLAHFISTAGQSGIAAALRAFDLSDIRDKPLGEFLDALADRLAGDGGLLDDDSLNSAMADTFDKLAENATSVDDLEELLGAGNVDIESILRIFYTKLLANNFEQKQYAVVREKIARENTANFFAQARTIIEAIVRDELSATRDLASIDWNSDDGLRIADEINQEVMDILIP